MKRYVSFIAILIYTAAVNIRALENFLSLAQQLHFGRASVASNISISALSRSIRQLEDEVGVRLFDRDNRSVSLTTDGERFEQYAKNASRQWQVICNELNASRDELQGEISLYCSVTASHSILFDLLNRFRPDYPGIEIKLHTGDPEIAISRIVAGQEEIAIAALPKSPPRGVVFKLITESPLVFIAANHIEHIVVPGRGQHARKEWAEVPMILSEGGMARTRVNDWFKNIGVSPRIYAQVAGNEAIVSMVSLGLGVGVVPKIVLDNSPLADRIRVVEVKPQLKPFNLGLVVLKKNLDNPLVNAFWNL